MTRRRGVATTLLLFALLGGCSQPSDESGQPAAPGQGAAGTDDPADAAGKSEHRADADPATERDDFMPTLERAYNQVAWPSGYTMSVDEVWSFMATGAVDTAYSEADATSMVEIWNACAWTMQLIDETKTGQNTEQSVTKLTDLSNGALGNIIGKVISDAKLNEITTARQFVTANDCAAGFK